MNRSHWKGMALSKLDFINKNISKDVRVEVFSHDYKYNIAVILDGKSYYDSMKKETFRRWENVYDYLSGIVEGYNLNK